MDEELIKKIVLDLQKKWPSGPEDYESSLELQIVRDPMSANLIEEPVCLNRKGYGWGDDMLFETRLHSRFDVDWFFKKILKKENRRKLKVDRVWRRLNESIIRVRQYGLKGIYEMKISFSKPGAIGHLWAKNIEEAKFLAETMMGYLAVDEKSKIIVTPKRRGTKEDVKEENKKIISTYQKDFKRNLDLIISRKEENDKILELIKIIDNSQGHFS